MSWLSDATGIDINLAKTLGLEDLVKQFDNFLDHSLGIEGVKEAKEAAESEQKEAQKNQKEVIALQGEAEIAQAEYQQKRIKQVAILSGITLVIFVIGTVLILRR